MATHERYQLFCQRCFRTFEGDSVAEALKRVTEHEKKCLDKPKLEPAPKSLEADRT